jgi:hypothetical protein
VDKGVIMYYANINSKDVLIGVGMGLLTKDEYDSENVKNIEVSAECYYNAQQYGSNYYIYSNGEIILNPNYEQEQAQKRQTNFETEFFNTSLGWIRRQVNMKDGSTKDFLSDLLPAISMALNSGIATPIITYKTPDFTQDITDWTIYQEIKQVTPQFIQECFNQLSADFGAV